MRRSQVRKSNQTSRRGREDALSRALASLNTNSDRKAAHAIRRLQPHKKEALPVLRKMARDPKLPLTRKWSLEALGALGDRSVGRLLVAALSDPRMTVRLHALRGIAKLRYARASRSVAKLIHDPSGGIRVNALHCLIAIGATQEGRAIRHGLKDPKWYVRQIAAKACGELRVRSSARDLSTLLNTENRAAVIAEARSALGALKGLK